MTSHAVVDDITCSHGKVGCLGGVARRLKDLHSEKKWLKRVLFFSEYMFYTLLSHETGSTQNVYCIVSNLGLWSCFVNRMVPLGNSHGFWCQKQFSSYIGMHFFEWNGKINVCYLIILPFVMELNLHSLQDKSRHNLSHFSMILQNVWMGLRLGAETSMLLGCDFWVPLKKSLLFIGYIQPIHHSFPKSTSSKDLHQYTGWF